MDFNITDSAAKRVEFLLQSEEQNNLRFRIEVLGGGCSGFQYNFDFDSSKKDDDLIFTHMGVDVVIDESSLEFVKGSVLDFVETLGSQAFVVRNPNATANCGCGNSFAV